MVAPALRLRDGKGWEEGAERPESQLDYVDQAHLQLSELDDPEDMHDRRLGQRRAIQRYEHVQPRARNGLRRPGGWDD